MAALISSVMSTKDKVPFFVARCEEMGIGILPPDVNLSDHEFTGRARATSASAWMPSRASATRRWRRSSGRARSRPARSLRCGTSASAWTTAPSTRRRSRRSSSAARSVPPAPPARGCSRCSSRLRGPARRPSRTRRSARARSSTSEAQAGRRRRGSPAPRASAQARRAGLARPGPPTDPRRGVRAGELLAVEKEAIGLFVSAHPLKPVREALRARVDCTLAALAERRDKEWVTVGGIVTEAKRIRTRNGDPMMFATLDDLEGSVEMLVFGKALAEHEAALAVDQVVLVRGPRGPQGSRQDLHGRAVGRDVRAQRGGDRPARAQRRRAARERRRAPARACASTPTQLPASAIDELKQLIGDFPGPAEVCSRWTPLPALRRLRLGEAYRVQPTPAVRGRSWRRALGPASSCSTHATLRPGCLRRDAACAVSARCSARRAARTAAPACAALASSTSPRVGARRGSRPGSQGRRADSRRVRRRGRSCSHARPARPAPTLAWRSRRSQGGACESLRCSEPIRSRPTFAVDLAQQLIHTRGACGCHSRRRTGGRSRGTPPAAPAAGGVE